jgi:HPt (histidine-containing phosphotransfer) domain-containing protein
MEPSTADQPPSIPGIDSAELWERIGEDPDIFWEVLDEFSTAYRDSPAQIATLIGQDPVAAERMAHTLKGVLGNLAATDLFATCKALDEALRQGRAEDYPALLANLGAGVPALCDAIVAVRSGGQTAAAAGPQADAQWLAERYAALRAALNSHRARDCKALVDELAAVPLPTAEQPFFEQLQMLVRAYRFQDAQDLFTRHLDV